MKLSIIFIFFIKLLIIEALMTGLRYLVSAAWHNVWPKQTPNLSDLIQHDNRYYFYFINGLEAVTVFVLLYLGYGIPFIAISTFVAISIIDYVARKLLG